MDETTKRIGIACSSHISISAVANQFGCSRASVKGTSMGAALVHMEEQEKWMEQFQEDVIKGKIKLKQFGDKDKWDTASQVECHNCHNVAAGMRLDVNGSRPE